MYQGLASRDFSLKARAGRNPNPLLRRSKSRCHQWLTPLLFPPRPPMTHLGVDLARTTQPRTYKTAEETTRHHHRRLHRFASFLAQILCPIAPLFALPALTEGWYVKRSVDGLIVAVKSDPPLVVAAGAVTLALALLSNLSILFRLIDTHCVSPHVKYVSSLSPDTSPFRSEFSRSRRLDSFCPTSFSVS
jgi:hypothetical protein